MAVAVVMDFRGATLAQYDRVVELMQLTPKGQGPKGSISHFASPSATGILIVDVWETREAFDKFGAEQIGPFSAQAGVPGPPQITFYDVHNYFTPGAPLD